MLSNSVREFEGPDSVHAARSVDSSSLDAGSFGHSRRAIRFRRICLPDPNTRRLLRSAILFGGLETSPDPDQDAGDLVDLRHMA